MSKVIKPRGIQFGDPSDPIKHTTICSYFPDTDTFVWKRDKAGKLLIAESKVTSSEEAIRKVYRSFMQSPVRKENIDERHIVVEDGFELEDLGNNEIEEVMEIDNPDNDDND